MCTRRCYDLCYDGPNLVSTDKHVKHEVCREKEIVYACNAIADSVARDSTVPLALLR